jgi:hypothetical protein
MRSWWGLCLYCPRLERREGLITWLRALTEVQDSPASMAHRARSTPTTQAYRLTSCLCMLGHSLLYGASVTCAHRACR